MSFKFKVGDKVRLTKDISRAGTLTPEGTVGEVYSYWNSDSPDVPYPYWFKWDNGKWLVSEKEIELYTEKARFKSTGITVPFRARYLGTGAEVTVTSVTDTSFGRIYWVQSPEGFVFSLPAAMFITVV
jgi:hypothetical protein